ncbi:MAG TPA: glycerophosphodiester phosphodiesterase, partial [Candidatus Kapabacteria bacterium]|nr:glycerophosphodiester phosphodiesterase [Candidatus Kapabacteria bacterium]
NAKVFAPRWTLGTQNELIQSVQTDGRFAFVWTLDDQKFIRKFLAEGQFNGILTNFPSIVAYEYYAQ